MMIHVNNISYHIISYHIRLIQLLGFFDFFRVSSFLPSRHERRPGCGGRSFGARRLEGLHLHKAGGPMKSGRDTVAISAGG